MARDRLTLRFERFRRRGDTKALGAVFDALAPRLLRLALHWTGDPARAEDAVQQAFLVAIEKRESFDPQRRVEPWLVGICARIARSRRVSAADEALPELVDELDPADLVAARDANNEVERAIESLAEPYRSALRLRLLDGLSTAEAAIALDLPPGTVRSHLSRGMQRLRAGLPRGLASLTGMLVTHERGLAEVRSNVLAGAERCGALASAGLAPPPLALLLAMPKQSLALLSLVLIAGAGLAATLLANGSKPRPEGDPLAALASLEVAASSDPATLQRPPAAPARIAQVQESGDVASVEPASWTVRIADARLAGQREAVLSVRPDAGPPFSRPIRFDAGGAWSSDALLPGRYRLWTGRGVATVELGPGDVEQSDLRERDGLSVTLRVVDRDGQALLGAVVETRLHLGDLLELGRTDYEGYFRAGGLMPESTIRVFSDGQGLAEFELPWGRSGNVDRAVVLDSSVGTVWGSVVDDEGDPVAGAEVFLGRGSHGNTAGASRNRVFSDSRGEFRFEGVAVLTEAELFGSASGERSRGHVRVGDVFLRHGPILEAVVPGRGFGTMDLRPFVGAVSGHNKISLKPGGAIAGRVTDSRGEPLPGCLVRHTDRVSFLSTTTDSEGRYSLLGVPPERAVEIEIWRVDLLRTRPRKSFRLEQGERVEWSPVLEVGQTLAGTVSDHRGAPIDGARVALFGRTSVSGGDGDVTHVGDARSGDGGAFRFTPQDSYKVLYAMASERGYNGSELQHGPFPVPLNEAEAWTIRLGDPDKFGVAILLDVVDAERVPAAGVTVHLARLEGGRGGAAFNSFATVEGTGHAERTALAPGAWVVGVARPGHLFHVVGHRNLRAGERWDLGQVELGRVGAEPDSWSEQIRLLTEAGVRRFSADGVEGF